MIKIYSQYSYGGYKTLYIEGVEKETLGADSEVTSVNQHGFPQEAHVFYQFGGCKIAYLRLSSGELALVVREIPSNDVDGAGRAISCAVQFIGEDEDRQTLDNLAMVIANDVAAFGSFFADLFYVRQGLHIDGKKLRDYIDGWSQKTSVDGTPHPTLLSIGKKQRGVFLFVPLSEKFNKDKDVTNRVCEDLKLKKDELKGAVISLTEFAALQKTLKIVTSSQENASGTEDEGSQQVEMPPVRDEGASELASKNQLLKSQLEKKVAECQTVTSQLKMKEEECETVKKQLNYYKIGVCALAATGVVLAAALVYSCYH